LKEGVKISGMDTKRILIGAGLVLASVSSLMLSAFTDIYVAWKVLIALGVIIVSTAYLVKWTGSPYGFANIHPGDGIIDLRTDARRRGIVVGRNFTDPPGNAQGELVSVTARFWSDQMPEVINVGEFRRETFIEYMTRPTGFGKTHWALFFLIQLVLGIGMAYGIQTWNEGGWIGVTAWPIVNGVILLGTYMNYTRRWI